MIKVESLNKCFDNRYVIKDINFEVRRGEVVSLLGPNGAGKTTTLRILTTFFPPTSGKVTIEGFDIIKDSDKIRNMIGYMPENVPLYFDMRVIEYLKFRAGLHGISGKYLKKSIRDAIELCGLSDVYNQMIYTLSKGYRQRLGIASALVHNPSLLILDEPTAGLDPTHIIELRQIIKYLSKSHTILISTHFLSEAEKTCNKFLIINHGKLISKGSKESLIKQIRSNGCIDLELLAPESKANKVLNNIPTVKKVEIIKTEKQWLKIKIKTDQNSEIREIIYDKCIKENWKLRLLKKTEPTLEDIFNELTFSNIE